VRGIWRVRKYKGMPLINTNDDRFPNFTSASLDVTVQLKMPVQNMNLLKLVSHSGLYEGISFLTFILPTCSAYVHT
jgi:hypothetical protein